MKKLTVLFSLMLLAGIANLPGTAYAAVEFGKGLAVRPLNASPAPVPAAAAQGKPQWKSRAEYDAFEAFVKETSPTKRIPLIQAFLQKYPKSDFIANAYVAEMQTYQQLKETNKAIQAARQALKVNPDNLDALYYVTFTFPYIFKSSNPGSQAQLSKVMAEAKHGLQLLQNFQKPAGVSESQYNTFVKSHRTAFNTAIGFAAFQQKNYSQAIQSLQAAAQNNPDDVQINWLLGQSYYDQQPRDVNKAIWYLARAVNLAKKSNGSSVAQLQKFYGQVYENQHGSNAGEEQVLAQASSGTTPPAGFSVAPPPHHAATGDKNVDAFYKIEDALLVGGDTAQENWTQLKGQPLGLVGQVDSVVKGTAPGAYLVRVDITPNSKSAQGTYDIVLQDSQPNVKYLQAGNPLRFQGTIESYTTKPNFVITLSDVKIDNAVLKAAAEKAKADAQEKAEKRHKRRR